MQKQTVQTSISVCQRARWVLQESSNLTHLFLVVVTFNVLYKTRDKPNYFTVVSLFHCLATKKRQTSCRRTVSQITLYSTATCMRVPAKYLGARTSERWTAHQTHERAEPLTPPLEKGNEIAHCIPERNIQWLSIGSIQRTVAMITTSVHERLFSTFWQSCSLM